MIEFTTGTIDPVIAHFFEGLAQAPHFLAWRADLTPFRRRLSGTRTTESIASQRSFMNADWLIRTVTPMQFELWAATCPEDHAIAILWAQKLRCLPAIVDSFTARMASEFAEAASTAATEAIDFSIYGPDDENDPHLTIEAALAEIEHANAPYGDPLDYASSASATAAYIAEVASMAGFVAAGLIADEPAEIAARYAADGANVVGYLSEHAPRIWNESLTFLDRLLRLTEGSTTPN